MALLARPLNAYRESARALGRALLAGLALTALRLYAQEPPWVEAARGVIARFAGAEVAQSLTL